MYNALIEQYKAAQTAAGDAYRAVAQAEREAVPGLEDYLRATQLRSEYKTERELSEFCHRLADSIVSVASRRYAPASGRLNIDRAAECSAIELDISEALKDARIPDLDALAAHLERKFGGVGGAVIAYQQAARAIIDGFWLRPDSEMKRTSIGIVIDMPVQSEARWSGNGMRSISHYAQSRVAACFQGLATFARKAGFNALASQLSDGRYLREDYASRDKLTFSSLDIVRFNDKWQCKFALAVGEALSFFISEFGAEHLASRAR